MTKLRLLLLSVIGFVGQTSVAQNDFYEHIGNSGGLEFNHKADIKYEVLFFFNYNCSACLIFEDEIGYWEDNLPSKTAIKSIPFSAKPEWKWANKFHFYSNAIDNKASRKEIFKSDVIQKTTIQSEQDLLVALMNTHSISEAKAVDYIESIDISKFENIAKELSQKYKTYGTPTLVLNIEDGGVYKIQPNGKITYRQMVQIVNGLIAYHEKKLTNQE